MGYIRYPLKLLYKSNIPSLDPRQSYDIPMMLLVKISARGMKDEDTRVCITTSGGVGQSLEISKRGVIVDGVMIVEIPGEGDKEDEGI